MLLGRDRVFNILNTCLLSGTMKEKKEILLKLNPAWWKNSKSEQHGSMQNDKIMCGCKGVFITSFCVVQGLGMSWNDVENSNMVTGHSCESYV